MSQAVEKYPSKVLGFHKVKNKGRKSDYKEGKGTFPDRSRYYYFV
jgi:hypothetical protein